MTDSLKDIATATKNIKKGDCIILNKNAKLTPGVKRLLEYRE